METNLISSFGINCLNKSPQVSFPQWRHFKMPKWGVLTCKSQIFTYLHNDLVTFSMQDSETTKS